METGGLKTHLLPPRAPSAARRQQEADDRDPIEIPAAGRSRPISNAAETDGEICSEPAVRRGRTAAAGKRVALQRHALTPDNYPMRVSLLRLNLFNYEDSGNQYVVCTCTHTLSDIQLCLSHCCD